MASDHMTAKRAALRSRIIDAALAAFAARGFEATTMMDVARQLQMTGPALYHYFATKDALLFACITQLLDRLHADLSTAAAGAGRPSERLARVVRAQLAAELMVGAAAPLVNAHLYGPQYLTDLLQPAQRDMLRERQRALVQVYRTLIDEGVQASEFQVDSPAVATFNLLALVQYTGVWYRPRKGRQKADLIDAQVAAVLQLLGAALAAGSPDATHPISAESDRPPSVAGTTSTTRKARP